MSCTPSKFMVIITQMKNIAIYTKTDQASYNLAKHIKSLLEYQYEVLCIDQNTYKDIKNFKILDLLIVIGGDGTFLSSLRFLNSKYNFTTPVLGINQGTLGFLTECCLSEVDNLIKSILENDFIIEERALFISSIDNKLKEVFLNDIYIARKTTGKILNFDLYCDDEFISNVKADGVLVSTPTGSTAHSLSAGGPILHPKLEAMLITPVAPHTLTNRPIVVSNTSTIKIVINDADINIICDGNLINNDFLSKEVLVNLYEQKLKLIRPNGKTYFQILRNKLSFGRRN